MKEPSKIAEIMRIEMRAKTVSTEAIGRDPGTNSGRYRYELVFTDRLNTDKIEEKLKLIEEKEGLSLRTTNIEPRMEKTENALLGGFAIIIIETESRAKSENEDLTTFTTNNKHDEND